MFRAGVFVHGGVVGLTRSCLAFPGSIQALCSYVKQGCPQLVFSSFTVLANIGSMPHTYARNLSSEPNVVPPLSNFKHVEIWVET